MAMTTTCARHGRARPGGCSARGAAAEATPEGVATVIRRLHASEWEALRAHLVRLDPEARRLRFGRPVGEAAIHAYCDRIDRARTLVVGAFADGVLRGAAELVGIPDSLPPAAELAVSVEGPFQGRGLGRRLIGAALLMARNRFVRTVHLVALDENERLKHLARAFGARLVSRGAAAEGRIELPPPTALMVLEEMTAESRALADAVREPRTAGAGRAGAS